MPHFKTNPVTSPRLNFCFSSQQQQQLQQLSLNDFDFELPEQLIAQHPAKQRQDARLLDGRESTPYDRQFNQLPSLLRAGDLLVFNDTKVVKARLLGEKPTGGKVEILVERVLDNPTEILAHFKSSRKPAPGTILNMQGGYQATLVQRWPDEQGKMFIFRLSANAFELMQAHGHVPLPPYITHSDSSEDERRYQTVFARHPGAVAAPTAALHFDQAILEQLAQQQIDSAEVTLHVGAGTFQPVKTDSIAEHEMHFERYQISADTIAKIQHCRQNGGRVIAVGTTTVRALEAYALSGQTAGDTNIFITPGFEFKLVDLLVTNFHLPKSTLMLLVSAFAGQQHIRQLYQHAISNNYRFFSYGDAMLLQAAK